LKSKFRLFGIVFIFFWFFAVLYPNPSKFFITLSRFRNPPTTYLVEELRPLLEESFGKSPEEIKEIVKQKVPYNYDWDVYGLPLYFPSVKEIMEKDAGGDCKSQFLITASIFEYYNIEYVMLASTVHIWIGYEKRPEKINEREEVVVQEVTKDKIKIKFPEEIDWKYSGKTFYGAFWKAMPLGKKIMLYLGFFLSLFIFFPKTFLYSIIKKE
jgi:hypothetical protein